MAKISIRVPVRWSDLDAYGHVNNAAMLTLLEEARIKVFWAQPEAAAADSADANTALAAAVGNALMGDRSRHTLTVIASQQIEYLVQIPWVAEPVRVEVWVGNIGGASFDVSYTVTLPTGELAAKAATTVVMIDGDTGRPTRLRPGQVEALELIREDPVTFRR